MVLEFLEETLVTPIRPPKFLQLVFLFVLLYLPPMLHHETMLVLRVEILDDFFLLNGEVYVLQTSVKVGNH
jgi:hypothetical protein